MMGKDDEFKAKIIYFYFIFNLFSFKNNLFFYVIDVLLQEKSALRCNLSLKVRIIGADEN